MICPSCTNKLTPKTVDDITVDTCENGCGGLWFDAFELRKVDEPKERKGEALLEIKRKDGIRIKFDRQRRCPKCKSIVMRQFYFSVKRLVQIDECGQCGGVWLDVGELAMIRSQFKNEQERREAAEQYFTELFGATLDKITAEEKEKLEKARQIASVFRFLCPSNYLPGKQKWGAF
ncbi:MAG: zf-TFIIB domain-containing protein [Candidatus Omnitrophota bacterium]|nr:zf-TFIIB domain-containing protein [Candidatus Omnitrophota bacterium]MDZ4242036.1 zf-TFIIB domain-containing protein [Candidatus Omnitrophota bacterium]